MAAPYALGTGGILAPTIDRTVSLSHELEGSVEDAYRLEDTRFWQGGGLSDALSSRPPTPLSPLTDIESSDDDSAGPDQELPTDAHAACNLWSPAPTRPEAMPHPLLEPLLKNQALGVTSLIAAGHPPNPPVRYDHGAAPIACSMRAPAKNNGTELKRRREAAIARRRKKRIRSAMLRAQPKPPSIKRNPLKAHVLSPPLKTCTNMASLTSSSSKGAWTGAVYTSSRDTPPNLQELVDDGFNVVEWDGRTTIVMTDAASRVIAAFVGSPHDPTWPAVIEDAAKNMREAQQVGDSMDDFSDERRVHRRGNFISLPAGVSYGGGQKKPGNLMHGKGERRLIEALLRLPSIRRIAGFQSSAFATYAPKLYQYYDATLGSLFRRHSGLVRNFANSIFPAISFNCGPSTVAVEHIDYGNLSHGLCALTALGDYDHARGGHIILYTLRTAVQFPPGSTALIPSGCIAHGNTSIQRHEIRLSITQYASGGLFRWVAYGFQAAKRLGATSSGKKKKDGIDQGYGIRWRLGVNMFSRLHELHDDLIAAFSKRTSPYSASSSTM